MVYMFGTSENRTFAAKGPVLTQEARVLPKRVIIQQAAFESVTSLLEV
jgi:hypothetical protein